MIKRVRLSVKSKIFLYKNDKNNNNKKMQKL